MADAEDLKSAKYFVLFTNKYLNKRGFGHNNRPRLVLHNSFTFSALKDFGGIRGDGTPHDPGRQGSRLQTSEQRLLAMFQLPRQEKPPHEHEGREPVESQGDRRRLVTAAPRQAPHRRDQNRENLRRSVGTVSARVRPHHPGLAQQGLRRRPALAVAGAPGTILRPHGSFRNHCQQGPGVPNSSP